MKTRAQLEQLRVCEKTKQQQRRQLFFQRNKANKTNNIIIIIIINIKIEGQKENR